MLQCPLCATRYADGTTACPLDHGQLVPVPTPGEYGPRWTPSPGALNVSSRGSASLGATAARPTEPGAEPGSEPTPAVDPMLGQILGAKLRVLRRIGQGGMGTVYVAEHVGLGKQVAVKVLSAPEPKSEAAPGPAEPEPASELVRRLHTEARHTAAIKNEHIVEIFDIGTTAEGRPYVEMELLTGESLAQRLARCSALSEADTLRIGRQLASALAAAHNSGIVHRDIKPENIFLCAPAAYGKDPGEGDFVKVLDFGISKAVRALPSDTLSEDGEPRVAVRETRLTRTGAILGTPLYMSPEQVRGEPLDHRVDVYAVGVVLYECLTGSVPHGACNYLAVVAKILTEKPEPPSQRSPERSISPELEQIVLRAMATDRKERYPTMEALHEDMRRYESGQELLPRFPAAAPAAVAAAVISEHGGAFGHLWRPILIGMVLVLGLGGGVAAVLRPRGPWSEGPWAATRVDSRLPGRTPAPGTGPAAPAVAQGAPQAAGQPAGLSPVPPAGLSAAPPAGLSAAQSAGLSASPSAGPSASPSAHRAAGDPEGRSVPAGPAVPSGSSGPLAGQGRLLSRGGSLAATGRTPPAGTLPAASARPERREDSGSHPPHRRGRLPTAPTAAHKGLSSLPDEPLLPLLEEQAPNPFTAPPAAAAAGRTGSPRADAAADDTGADPR